MPLNEYEFPQQKISNVQAQLERLIEKNYYLHKVYCRHTRTHTLSRSAYRMQSAKDAYRSYVQAYASHSHKAIHASLLSSDYLFIILKSCLITVASSA